jgi:hypothetical protein
MTMKKAESMHNLIKDLRESPYAFVLDYPETKGVIITATGGGLFPFTKR